MTSLTCKSQETPGALHQACTRKRKENVGWDKLGWDSVARLSWRLTGCKGEASHKSWPRAPSSAASFLLLSLLRTLEGDRLPLLVLVVSQALP